MGKHTLFKNTVRSGFRSGGRFLSLFGILAISAGFFSGLKVTGTDMKDSAERYYRDTGLADLHLRSSAGFDEAEIELLAAREDVAAVCGGYQETVLMPVSDDAADAVVRIYSITPDGQLINRPVLTEGRMPEKADECLIEAQTPAAIHVGDKVRAVPQEGQTSLLECTEFTVVGRADSSLYVDFERGSAVIGNGKVDCFLLVPPEAFSSDVYTDAWLRLTDTADLNSFSPEYLTAVNAAADAILADRETLSAPREAELRQAAEDQIAEQKQALEEGRALYESGVKQLESSVKKGKAELKKAEDELKTSREELDKQWAEYKKNAADYEKKSADLTQQQKTMDTQEQQAKANAERLNGKISQLEHAADVVNSFRDYQFQNPLPDDIQALINEMSEYDSGDLNASQTMREYFTTPVDSGAKNTLADDLDGYFYNCKVGWQNQLVDVQDTLNQLAVNRTQLKKNIEKLTASNQDVIKLKDELNAQEKKLTEAKLDLSRRKTDLEKEERVEQVRLAETRQDLEESEAAAAEAEQSLGSLVSEIEWYAFDRTENPGWSSYGEDADRVDRIAKVFPVFFLLVASLVCLTTMTRMVEEQRTEIGTCKALGYSGGAIASQYLLYAVLASVLGTAVGTVIGDQVFPRVIFICYQMMYRFPQIRCPYHWGYAGICLAAALLCTGVTAAAACASEMRELPAMLMRPKPPKKGKRVLLEKWKGLWKHLSFHTKVTIRNFFRYRARVLMTVVGICGCTALLVTGFGLYHAIAAIVDLQYGEILVYDAVGFYDGSEENKALLRDTLEESDAVTDYLFGTVRTCTVRANDKSYEVTVTVPEEAEAFSNFVVLRDRKTKESFSLENDGIIVNEKLAKLLGIQIGDTVTLTDAKKPVAVTAGAESYALNRIWMTPACYESLFGEQELNCVFLNEQADTNEDALAEELLQTDALMRLDFNSGSGDSFRKLVKALGYVVAVIIVFSGLLAFAVLYNLAHINILERIMELATVKVLGFYDREVYAYVLRENILSSLLGIAAGLIAGIFLCRYVVATAEVDVVMFAPDIPWYCFVLAAVMTMIFTLLVNLLLRRKLRAIDMAGSMKAIE